MGTAPSNWDEAMNQVLGAADDGSTAPMDRSRFLYTSWIRDEGSTKNHGSEGWTLGSGPDQSNVIRITRYVGSKPQNVYATIAWYVKQGEFSPYDRFYREFVLGSDKAIKNARSVLNTSTFQDASWYFRNAAAWLDRSSKEMQRQIHQINSDATGLKGTAADALADAFDVLKYQLDKVANDLGGGGHSTWSDQLDQDIYYIDQFIQNANAAWDKFWDANNPNVQINHILGQLAANVEYYNKFSTTYPEDALKTFGGADSWLMNIDIFGSTYQFDIFNGGFNEIDRVMREHVINNVSVLDNDIRAALDHLNNSYRDTITKMPAMSELTAPHGDGGGGTGGDGAGGGPKGPGPGPGPGDDKKTGADIGGGGKKGAGIGGNIGGGGDGGAKPGGNTKNGADFKLPGANGGSDGSGDPNAFLSTGGTGGGSDGGGASADFGAGGSGFDPSSVTGGADFDPGSVTGGTAGAGSGFGTGGPGAAFGGLPLGNSGGGSKNNGTGPGTNGAVADGLDDFLEGGSGASAEVPGVPQTDLLQPLDPHLAETLKPGELSGGASFGGLPGGGSGGGLPGGGTGAAPQSGASMQVNPVGPPGSETDGFSLGPGQTVADQLGSDFASSAAASELGAINAASPSGFGGGGMPMMPGMGGGGGQQDKERERTTWLDEDEEVWGTDPDLAPAVIGRDDQDEEETVRPQMPGGGDRTQPQFPFQQPTRRATGRG